MRINIKNILGQGVALNTTFKKTNAPLVVGVFFVSLYLVGNDGVGLASRVNGPLQIHQESVTGSVIQFPLRMILDQLQTQLGVAYQAPKEELEQRVSVDLHGESLPQALAKILAAWDYALKIDPAGRVQEIFVVRKIHTGGPEEKAIKADDDRSVVSNSSRWSKRDRKIMGGLQEAEMDERHVESPSFGTSHPVIQPEPPQFDEWELRDAMDAAGMEMIPPTGDSGMEVTQVSEEAQQAILQSFNPPAIGSFEGTGYQEMNIAPVSAEEAQEILRSLNQSIGSSMEASLP